MHPQHLSSPLVSWVLLMFSSHYRQSFGLTHGDVEFSLWLVPSVCLFLTLLLPVSQDILLGISSKQVAKLLGGLVWYSFGYVEICLYSHPLTHQDLWCTFRILLGTSSMAVGFRTILTRAQKSGCQYHHQLQLYDELHCRSSYSKHVGQAEVWNLHFLRRFLSSDVSLGLLLGTRDKIQDAGRDGHGFW